MRVAGAELGVVLEHLQASLGILVDAIGDDEVAVGAAVRAADAAAQLVELGEPEVVGAVDEHRVGVRHVEPALHDQRRDEDVDLARDEAPHHLLEVLLAHLPVPHGDARAGRDATDVVGDRLDRLDAVVDEEDLAAAIEFAGDSLLDEPIVPRLDEGEHRRAVARRRLHQRHVAQAGERQVQRARDRRGGEREDVGLQLELLEAFLVLHAEAVFLVDDDQPQLRKDDIVAQQAMRPDHDVDRSLGDLGEDGRLFLRRLEARDDGDADGKVGESFGEGAEMLLGEDRGGDEHRDLSPALDRLERRANGDLGLAVAHVADEEAIHGARLLHVALHVGRRLALVGRVLEEEGALDLPLPRGVGEMRRARGELPPRVEDQQLLRHLLDGGARLLALLRPAASAELVQLGGRGVVADVDPGAIALDLVDAIERDVEAVAAFVLDDRDLDRALAHEELLDAAIDPHAVLEVDDVVAGLERGNRLERRRRWRTCARGAAGARAGRSRGR